MGNAESIIESFSGTVGPAGTAVGLISDMVNNIFAFRPVFTSIEVSRDIFGNSILGFGFHRPLGVDNCTEKHLDFLVGGTIELVVDTSNPGAIGVRVNLLDVLMEVNRSLVHEKVEDILIRAEFKGLAGLFKVVKVKRVN